MCCVKVFYACTCVELYTDGSIVPHKYCITNFSDVFISTGYLNNEKATSECLSKDGWFYSGDIGYFDDEHNFFIVDRLKELIKYKGFQVFL